MHKLKEQYMTNWVVAEFIIFFGVMMGILVIGYIVGTIKDKKNGV